MTLVPALASTITCPGFGFASVEVMPTDASQWLYLCKHCHAKVCPKKGDCCVFCS